jgi:hypothetical protein
MRHAEIGVLREQYLGLRVLDVGKAIFRKLRSRIYDYKVIGRETPPDVIDADGNETFWLLQQVQGFAAAAHDERLACLRIAEIGKRGAAEWQNIAASSGQSAHGIIRVIGLPLARNSDLVGYRPNRSSRRWEDLPDIKYSAQSIENTSRLPFRLRWTTGLLISAS